MQRMACKVHSDFCKLRNILTIFCSVEWIVKQTLSKWKAKQLSSFLYGSPHFDSRIYKWISKDMQNIFAECTYIANV